MAKSLYLAYAEMCGVPISLCEGIGSHAVLSLPRRDFMGCFGCNLECDSFHADIFVVGTTGECLRQVSNSHAG